MESILYFRTLKQYGLTTQAPEPEKLAGSEYCSRNRCYTPTEFALFGVGTVVMGMMVGVVGISWFKHQCLPEEYEEYEEMRGKEKERRTNFRISESSSPFTDDEGSYCEKDICGEEEDPRAKIDVTKQLYETAF